MRALNAYRPQGISEQTWNLHTSKYAIFSHYKIMLQFIFHSFLSLVLFLKINLKKLFIFFYKKNIFNMKKKRFLCCIKFLPNKCLGFSTAKGELVRSILFPKPVNFKLKYDLIKCMGIFFCLGIPCMIYTAYCFTHFGVKL